MGADGVASEGLHGAGLGGLGLSPDEPKASDEDIRLHHEPPPSISRFLTLPEVTVSRQRRRSKALTDYSKSIILTSENYISMMEEKSARREAVERAKAEKQQLRQVEKKRREEEKIKELENKKLREEERARKKAFDKLWAPAACSEYGQRLHDRIRSGEPLPANSYRAPYLRFPPQICIDNQRVAIEWRRAKRRKESTDGIPPLTVPEWVHKPGALLWSRIASAQAQNPTSLSTVWGGWERPSR